MAILLRMLYTYVALEGFCQYVARKGHQAVELIHVIRAVQQKIQEWRKPLITVGVEIWKAFDAFNIGAIVQLFERRKLPIRLRYAFLREPLSAKTVKINYLGRSAVLFKCSLALNKAPLNQAELRFFF